MTGIGNRGLGIGARRRLAVPVLCAMLLAGCAGGPPPPDWKLNAHGGLEGYARDYLNGDSRLAELQFARAKAEIARTGRLDLDARAELYRCGVRAAALDFSPCTAFEALRPHATPGDGVYADFLEGRQWTELDAKALPAAYAGVAGAKDEAARHAAVQEIQDQVSRLIAAGVLFRRGELGPAGLAEAARTASDRGWRRPLLAWLKVLHSRAERAGDGQAAAIFAQRIRLVENSLKEK